MAGNIGRKGNVMWREARGMECVPREVAAGNGSDESKKIKGRQERNAGKIGV
jgi:hypothetical protein